jgi:hypothetical protein
VDGPLFSNPWKRILLEYCLWHNLRQARIRESLELIEKYYISD